MDAVGTFDFDAGAVPGKVPHSAATNSHPARRGPLRIAELIEKAAIDEPSAY
jgi:hypothetical protein